MAGGSPAAATAASEHQREGQEEFRTPTGTKFRIPSPLTCPPAPKRQRMPTTPPPAKAITTTDPSLIEAEAACNQVQQADEDKFRTPTATNFKIPCLLTCPPAPKLQPRLITTASPAKDITVDPLVLDQHQQEGEEEFRTPTGTNSRIPSPLTCPPAPRLKPLPTSNIPPAKDITIDPLVLEAEAEAASDQHQWEAEECRTPTVPDCRIPNPLTCPGHQPRRQRWRPARKEQ